MLFLSTAGLGSNRPVRNEWAEFWDVVSKVGALLGLIATVRSLTR